MPTITTIAVPTSRTILRDKLAELTHHIEDELTQAGGDVAIVLACLDVDVPAIRV